MLAFLKEQISSVVSRVTGRESDLDTVFALLPEINLRLIPSSRERWSDTERLDGDHAKLEAQGLEHCGFFNFKGQGDFSELSIWQYKNAVTIALCETSNESDEDDASLAQYSMSAVVKLSNGHTLSISNAESADWLPQPEQHRTVKSHAGDVYELLKSLKKNTPVATKIIPSKDPLALFSEHYEGYSAWLWTEEQLASSAFAEACEALDISLSDNDLDELIETGREQLSSAYTRKILTRLEQSSQMSDETWEEIRNRLVVVHEKMTADDISNTVYRLVTSPSVDQEEMIDEFSESVNSSTPLESFRELISSLNSDAKRIATMSQPVSSEIYLAD